MTANSIRFKLIKRLLLVLLAIAIATNTALYIYLRGELIEQYDDALETESRAVAAIWKPGEDVDRQAKRIMQTFPQLRLGRHGGDFIRIVRRDGSTVLHVPPADGPELQRPVNELPAKRRRIYDLTLPDGTAGRAVEIGIEPPSSGATTVAARFRYALVLAESRHELDKTLSHMASGLLMIGGGLSLASLLFVFIAVREELRPLHDFSESVGRLNADSLTFRFPEEKLADELRPISLRLNDMLQRLEAAFNRERRFTGNVAHELRTPLAELRSMIEVAMKWPPEPAELRQHHGSLLDVVQRMSSVVQNLLTLVRSDSAKLRASLIPLDLVKQTQAAAAPHEQAAARRGVNIQIKGPTEQTVQADECLLSSLLDNLFSNAATYAAPDSTVRCEVIAGNAANAPRLRMTNAVTDLTSDDLVRLEEPLWRKETARSAGDHAGLGLSLVRAYATALRIQCNYTMPDATHFTVELIWPPNAAPDTQD